MCILLYVKFLWCSSIPYIYGQLEGGSSVLSICALCYMLDVFGVEIFHISMVNWSLGTSALSICTFCYMSNLFCVVVFHGSMVDWRCSSASRSPKFGVVVFRASLLEWGGQSVIDPCSTITSFPCQLTIEPCYTITPQKSAQDICALCYI